MATETDEMEYVLEEATEYQSLRQSVFSDEESIAQVWGKHGQQICTIVCTPGGHPNTIINLINNLLSSARPIDDLIFLIDKLYRTNEAAITKDALSAIVTTLL